MGNVRSGSQQAISIAAAVLAVALALMVFYVDTFTSTRSAIAVLYGPAILLASDVLSRRRLLAAAVICIVATLISYFLSEWQHRDMAAQLSLLVSLATTIMTAAVLSRWAVDKERVLETNAALKLSEARFRSIFEQSLVALWQQDFTRLVERLSGLRNAGISDIRTYASLTPGFLRECADLVKTVEANNATHELLSTRSAIDVSGSISRFLRDDDDCFTDVIASIFEGRPRFEGTGKFVRSDGTLITVLIAISFPEHEVGFDRVIVGMFDVTQRDLTQQALLAAQTEMARASRVATVGALSASLAHELNQPIGALVLNARSCLRWMRRDPPDLPSACEAAERIVRDGHRAAEILKRTRQMVTRNPASAEALNLGQLIGETCLMLEQELSKASVVLQTRMPASLPNVRIARPELQQVLVNLLSNGIHAVSSGQPEHRRLAIECQLDEASFVRISVRDHGPGIKEEHLKMLFDPFFTTKIHGMGIGLSISRSIIEGQGGNLTVRNHESGGAVFEIRLPVEVQDG